jgi:hypothetical protein
LGEIIEHRHPGFAGYLIATLLAIASFTAQGHSNDAARITEAPVRQEFLTGTVERLLVENRVLGSALRYVRLRHSDGTATALTGPDLESLSAGATATVLGHRSATHFTVEAIQPTSGRSSSPGTPSGPTLQIEGTLTIAHADDFASGSGQYSYEIHDDAGGVTPLNLSNLPSDLHGGSRVIVTGRLSVDGASIDPDTITIESDPTGNSVQSGPVAKSSTSNSVLVILANFNNTGTQSYTAAQAQQVMTTDPTSVANYYSETSYGQQLLNVTVTSSWVTMNLAGTCDYTAISSAANAAAQALNATYTAANYNYVVYLFPSQPCGWAGLAYVGFPHQAFINGIGSFVTQVVAHEMGHNFGLWHSGSLSCGAAAIGGSCSVAEYGDPWDTMGNQRAMHFNAMQKSRLGWIPGSSVVTHSAGSANYTLAPLESAGGAVYAVKIPTSNSSRTYWLEYRQPIGFDAPLSAYPTNGVQVRVSNPFEWASGSDDTEIVDMTPGSGGGFGDSALLVGQQYLDSTYGVNIIVTGASGSAVTVSVSKGGGTTSTTTLASSANPSTAGSTVTFTATVTGTSPTGPVNFTDGGASIAGCGAVAVSGSGNTRTAACSAGALAASTHRIVASYSGDSANAASTSSVLSQTINKASSTTSLATSQTPSLLGVTVTFTAAVNGSAPTGTVNFLDGGTSIASCSSISLTGTGNLRTAACSTLSLLAGTHSITAAYAGDASNTASTSAALSQVVNSASLPTSLVNAGFEVPSLGSGYQYGPTGSGVGWSFNGAGIQGNGSAWGATSAPEGTQTAFIQSTSTISQALNLNAGSYTLSFKAAQRGCCVAPYVQPVQVTMDGVQIGSLVSPASTSFATFSIAFTVATSGAHTIAFAGTDPSDKTTFIDALSLTAAVGSTTTALASSLNPSTVGASVALTATVNGNAPTGSVAFTDGGSAIGGCTGVALSGGGNNPSAVCSPSGLSAGTHTIVATYSGDALNGASSSAALSQVVNATPPSSLVNAGFEVPSLGSGYQYGPTGSGVGWSFSSNSGIQGNGSAWGAATADEGTQTAFIQSTSTISQALNLNAGSYTLSFKAAQRSCCVATYVQPVKVTVDGVQIGSLVSPVSTSFAAFSIPFTVVTSGAHTIAFAGTDSSDKTTFIDAVTLVANSTSLVNPGFEIPALGSGYQYNPTGSGIGWSFNGSGIQGNGSAWGAASAPEGTQTAFIQGTSTIAQTVNLNAGTNYTLSFQAAQRACCAAPYVQPVMVLIDGAQIGSLISPPSTVFTAFSLAFSVSTTAPHTITFAGTDGSDKTTFIDNVTLSP